MKICILGATGYLGNHIISHLIDDSYNYEVFCICRKDSKSEYKFINEKSVTYIVSDYNVLRDLFKTNKFDCIINASCTYLNGGARIDDVVESNLIFPMRVMSLATENYYGISSEYNSYNKSHNDKKKQLRFISIGTGLPNNFNIYTYTKKQFNKMGHFFSNEYGLEFINIELENYYGEFEPKNRFLPSVIDKLKNNENIPLTQGEQLRDFIYISDVMDAIKLLIIKKDIPPYLDLSLGTGEAPSIKQLITYLKQLMNSKSELQFGRVPLRPNEPSSCANITMYKILGGEIKYDWKSGLKLMLQKEGIL